MSTMSNNYSTSGNYRLLKVESASRDSGDPSNFRVQLPRPLHKGDTFQLELAHIPNTYYNIDASNNTFTINETGIGVFTVVLTPGFYTNPSAVAELQNQLNDPGWGGSLTYTCVVPANTQRVVVTASGNFSVLMSGVSNPFGFAETTVSAASHEGSTIVNTERHQSLNIDLNQTTEVEGVSFGSTFCLPASVNVLQVLDYTSRDSFPQTFTVTSDTKTLSVRLKDSGNETIDLHGSEWFFVLRSVM